MFGNANFDDSTNSCYKPNITDQNQTPLVDFDDFQSLSETDDELDESNYRILESLFWSQSITPGKYYTRVFWNCFLKINDELRALMIHSSIFPSIIDKLMHTF